MVLSASPNVLQVLQERADAVIHLPPCQLLLDVVGNAVLHSPGTSREEGEDVHAGRCYARRRTACRRCLALSMKSAEALTSTGSKVSMSYLARERDFCNLGTLFHVRERAAADLRPRSSVCRPCPNAASMGRRPCPLPSNAPDWRGPDLSIKFSSRAGTNTSTDPTSRRGGRGNRRTHRSREPSGGTCSSRRGGSCRTGRWRSLEP